jgi:hypothetical protein
LFLMILPIFNGLMDWISLSVSRWFGRAIVPERRSPQTLLKTLVLALADVILAAAFAFAVAWVLAFAVEAAGLWAGIGLELDAYVQDAATAPWTTGFWATFMILSTLLPSAMHLGLALGAVFISWSGNPLRPLVAKKLESLNEADWLAPTLYLTFEWTMAIIAAVFALWWLISFLVGFAESLPQALANSALHGIDTARAYLGS